ncbi:MAG TPA: HigA family addiction module antitoxin [Devosia sp.]|nr:HigA family addiction module antitoxin [Devosia sp.]
MSKAQSVIRVSPPVHPGEILREEFLAPLGLKPYTLAKRLMTSRARMERLVREEIPVTVDTALRLGKFFGTTPDFWLNLQSAYDLTVAETDAASGWLDDINAYSANKDAA